MTWAACDTFGPEEAWDRGAVFLRQQLWPMKPYHTLSAEDGVIPEV